MKLTFIGTGGLPTIGTRNPTSIFVKVGNKNILLDCGSGTLRGLAENKIDHLKLNVILISHAHLDHCLDLAPITASMTLTGLTFPKKKRKEKIIIRGPKEIFGVYKFTRSLIPAEDDFKVDMKHFAKEEKFDNLIVSSLPVSHMPQFKKESFAIKLASKSKSIVYSGDIDWSEKMDEFIEFCKGVNVLIIDGGKRAGSNVHLEPFQISQIAQKANPKQVVVVHLTDIDTPAAVHDGIAEFYKGEILIAKDGMELEV